MASSWMTKYLLLLAKKLDLNEKVGKIKFFNLEFKVTSDTLVSAWIHPVCQCANSSNPTSNTRFTIVQFDIC